MDFESPTQTPDNLIQLRPDKKSPPPLSQAFPQPRLQNERAAVLEIPLARREKAAEDILLSGSHQLVAEWKALRADYLNFAAHEKFVFNCFELGALSFAAQKYGEILKAVPVEETAMAMKKRIEGFASFSLESASAPRLRQEANGIPFTLRLPLLNQLLLVLGAICTIMGLFIPYAGYLVWVGLISLGTACFFRLFKKHSNYGDS